MKQKTKETVENRFSGCKLPEIGTKEFNDLASRYFGGKPNQKQLPSINESLTKLGVDYTKQAKANNSKIFKQFDESLFRAYIDKFSDEDKIWAFRTLVKAIPESNLKTHINSWFE